MIYTSASLLSGGGLFDLGAEQAGFTPLWGVEIEPDIAKVAERNIPGLSVIRGDVATVDYDCLERPYHLHASTICLYASIASQGGECEKDIAIAGGVVRAIEILQPVIFTLENVWFYRTFQAFKNILRCLTANAYSVDFWHLNAANYGVPQTRKRLILIARRDGQPVRKPMATHGKRQAQPTLFDTVEDWVGWYEAIEDLIPELPESKFADWQMPRLPDELFGNLLAVVQGGNSDYLYQHEPVQTITTAHSANKYRAFLLGQGERSYPKLAGSPADTITGNSNQTSLKAFLVRSDNASQETRHLIREHREPGFTVVNGAKSGMPRAFIVDCQKNGSTACAWLSQGRVVSMTPRALARFQSIPDTYELPDKKRLATAIIGNAVPPLLARRIMEYIRSQ